MRVLFIHGLESGPLGRKAVLLSNHPEMVTLVPLISPYNPWGSILMLMRECERFNPDVIVGSSYGAFLAMYLYRLRVWTGPMLLMSAPPSIFIDRPERHIYVHGLRDSIFPPYLSTKVVDEDHSLRNYSFDGMCKDVIDLGNSQRGLVIPRRSHLSLLTWTTIYILGDLLGWAYVWLVSKIH